MSSETPQTRLEPPLLERERERAALAAAVRGAPAGRGAAVVVRGPAGMGKTRLLAEARRIAEHEGVRLLYARGSELERGYAFGGARQLIAPLLGDRDKDADGLFTGAAAHAATVFDTAAVADSDSEPNEAVLYGLYWLLAGLSAEHPVVALVDDAHWLDAPTLRWLIFVLNRVAGSRIALIVASRPFDPATDRQLLDQLCAHPAAQLLTPPPLSANAVRAVAEAALDRVPDDDVVEALARATAGNPFYVHELLTSLAEPGPQADTARLLAPGSAPTVTESVQRRLARLSDAAVSLSRAVAVCGPAWGPSLPTELAGLRHEQSVEAFDELVRADVLAPGGLEFVHPLVRDVIYESLPAIERDRLHRATAEALIGRDAPDEQVAAHLLAADPREDDAARSRLVAAADQAWSRGAPDVAATFRSRALAEGAAGAERRDLLRALATAEIAASGTPVGLPHFRRALDEATEPRERAEICLQIARALAVEGDHSGAIEICRQAVDELGDRDPDLVAELNDRIALMSPLDLAQLERMGGLEGVIEQVRSRPEQRPLTQLGLAWSLVNSHPPVDEGADMIERYLEEHLPFDDETALGAASIALMSSGRYKAARAMWDRVVTIARAQGTLRALLRGGWTLRGYVLARMGRLIEAEEDMRQLQRELEMWSAGASFDMTQIRMGLPWVLSPLLDVLVDKGDLDEAQGWIDLTGVEAEFPLAHSFNYLLYGLARLRAAQGRREEAVARLRECGERQERWGIRNPGSIPWRSELAANVSDEQEAIALCDEQIELSTLFGVRREHGMALRVKGSIIGGPDGIALVRQALDVLDPDLHALEHARALIDLGTLLRAEGFPEEARDPLRQGMELAARCGAKALVARGNDELVATGARPRRPALSGVEALTASELRTAGLAASGNTNRQIAETLFVTEKTVEAHLRNAYKKLQISSRSQLAEALG